MEHGEKMINQKRGVVPYRKKNEWSYPLLVHS